MDNQRSCPIPDDRPRGYWLEFFGSMADRVVAEIGPKKVLVVGSGKGLLVEALRNRAVEAFGVDLCKRSLDAVWPDIRGSCRVASAVDRFDQHYDLIICSDVVERLSEAEGRQVIANICASTGDVLFCSTPEDFEEPAHLTVRPRSFWIDRFGEHDFHLDVHFDASFISAYAMRFRQGMPGGSPLDALLAQRDLLQSQLVALRLSAAERDKLIAEKDGVIAGLSFHLRKMQQTIGWKTLEQFRRVRDRLLPADTLRRKAYWALRRVVEVLLDEGLPACVWKTGHKIRQAWRGQGVLVTPPPQDIPQDLSAQYQIWLERNQLTSRAMTEMKGAVPTFTYAPLISIVTPVYNPDETWLRKAIESVCAQIYPHWELCLVDDASTKPPVKALLEEYAAADPRFQVKCLLSNEGIAGASNHALGLATGEFVSLLDHDDELSPDALFEVVKRLNEDPNLNLLYSDEDKLDPDGCRVEPFFKPDWSPDLLLSTNYINHFSVFRRSLLREVGGFRRDFNGSQDHDLLLRFTERTDKIAHIPKVLYHWRKAPGSAAAATTAKPFAHKPFAYAAGRRAIEDALRRRGHDGRVESSLRGLYTVRYRLRSTPVVSIIIPTRDRWQLIQQCVRSVEERTSYTRYEIIVLDNDSADPETRQYLDAIAARWCVYRYPGPFNFSAINNFGAAQARGDYLLFLNNDTQVIRSDWLTALLEQAQRPEVGAVGAKLLYPVGHIQHAGVVLGIGGLAGHAFRGLPDTALSYFGFADLVRNCSAVTAACMMVPRRVFEEVEGFDERFRVAFNDVDFCLRLRQRGYLIVYTPLALLYHHEYATRGQSHPPEDEELYRKLWSDLLRRGDPYYNPNLTLSREDWSLSL